MGKAPFGKRIWMPRVDIAHANAQRLTVFMLNDAAVCREHGE
jgi:hypothetical protein